MRKWIILSIFIFITMQSFGQMKKDINITVNFFFNNYKVCDLSDNFQFYFFYIDSNNCYKLDSADVFAKNINMNFDFSNNKLLNIIFKYKNYILIFRNDKDFFEHSFVNDTVLIFKIEKRKHYQKYIRKSYSKSNKKKSKIRNWEFDVSCNGLLSDDHTFHIDMSDAKYRKYMRENFKSVSVKKYYNTDFEGEINVCYSKNETICCISYKYKNYNKFFIENELLFQKLTSLNGLRAILNPNK